MKNIAPKRLSLCEKIQTDKNGYSSQTTKKPVQKSEIKCNRIKYTEINVIK